MEPDIVADSVADAITQLREAGYRADLSGHAGQVHCSSCRRDHAAEHARVDHIYRYEGPSDPDEEAIVLALTCPTCQTSGVLVSGYGPSTDPDDIDLIVALVDRRR